MNSYEVGQYLWRLRLIRGRSAQEHPRGKNGESLRALHIPRRDRPQFQKYAYDMTQRLRAEFASANPYIQALRQHRNDIARGENLSLDRQAADAIPVRLATEGARLAELTQQLPAESPRCYHDLGCCTRERGTPRAPPAATPCVLLTPHERIFHAQASGSLSTLSFINGGSAACCSEKGRSVTPRSGASTAASSEEAPSTLQLGAGVHRPVLNEEPFFDRTGLAPAGLAAFVEEALEDNRLDFLELIGHGSPLSKGGCRLGKAVDASRVSFVAKPGNTHPVRNELSLLAQGWTPPLNPA